MQAETELRNDLDLDDRETVLAVYDHDSQDTNQFIIVAEQDARVIIYLHGMFCAL